MRFDFSGTTPLFRQVAEQISEAIVSGAFAEGEQVPSTTEISSTYAINPATVLKGMNLLVDQGLLEKRRGLGMFVTTGAREKARDANARNCSPRGSSNSSRRQRRLASAANN
mgnify:CR=1 FL=1